MIACLTVPYFAAAAERRAMTPLATTPLAIGGRPWESKPIFAFSQEVARHGVKAGMSLRLAHVLSPEAHFLPATRPRYLQASGEIVDVLLDFSSAVEPEEAWHPFAEPSVQFTVDGQTLPARYFLDLDGLPATESLELAREMGRFLREETHFAPALGLAGGRFAAQVAATLTRPNYARLIAPGDDAVFLASQSIAFLPLEGELLRRLRLLGIGTLGDLARLPRSAAITQFGPTIAPLHRLACGQAAERPAARLRSARPHESADHIFEPAVADRLVAAAVIRRLAGQLAEQLATGGWAARTIYLAWETEDGRRDQSTLTLRQPAADERHLAEAWLELLTAALAGLESDAPASRGETATGRGLARLALGSRDLVPATARQMSLFDETAARAQEEAWAAVRALMARHGADAFWRPILTEPNHPLPERRFQWQSLSHDPAMA